jgi:hypothetical protein
MSRPQGASGPSAWRCQMVAHVVVIWSPGGIRTMTVPSAYLRSTELMGPSGPIVRLASAAGTRDGVAPELPVGHAAADQLGVLGQQLASRV